MKRYEEPIMEVTEFVENDAIYTAGTSGWQERIEIGSVDNSSDS